MQRRKIVIATLSLLLVGLALPSANINKAHAFTSGNNSFSISNITTNFISPTFGSGTVGQSGSSITILVTIQASAFNNPAYQRNVTVGFKGDWMSQYTNASSMPLNANQIGSTTLTIALPTVSALSPNHFWNIEIWDGPVNSNNIGTCQGGDGSEQNRGSGSATACFSLASGTISVLTSDQYAAAQARNVANTLINSIGLGGLSNSAANAQLDQAGAELTLGDQSWRSGDFSGARTHYQNAQTDANNALSTAYNLNGGSQNAGIVSIIESGTGILLFGVGGLLAGLGGLFYLRRKPKA